MLMYPHHLSCGVYTNPATHTHTLMYPHHLSCGVYTHTHVSIPLVLWCVHTPCHTHTHTHTHISTPLVLWSVRTHTLMHPRCSSCGVSSSSIRNTDSNSTKELAELRVRALSPTGSPALEPGQGTRLLLIRLLPLRAWTSPGMHPQTKPSSGTRRKRSQR